MKRKGKSSVNVSRSGDKFVVQYTTDIDDMTLADVEARIEELTQEIGFIEFKQAEMAEALALRNEELEKLKKLAKPSKQGG